MSRSSSTVHCLRGDFRVVMRFWNPGLFSVLAAFTWECWYLIVPSHGAGGFLGRDLAQYLWVTLGDLQQRLR